MLRRVGYRSAATVFVFAGLWFVLGLVALVSGVPGALGIGGEMFLAWLFLLMLGVAFAGATLTMAAINGLFPPSEPADATKPKTATSARNDGMPVRPRTDTRRSTTTPTRTTTSTPPAASATHDAEGRPLPWTQSPLPERPLRRTTPRPSRPADERTGR
jgi:hypothetical protein